MNLKWLKKWHGGTALGWFVRVLLWTTALGWFVRVLLWTAAASVLLMVMVWRVDPFLYYRKPGFFTHTYSSSNARHMLPGMLRHFEYDSVVAGNSQSQNFALAEVRDVLGWANPVKATVPASYPAAIRRFLEIAFAHRELKNVFVGVTLTQYRAPVDYIDRALDPYLYEPHWTTSFQYLMNSDVAFGRMPKNLLLSLGIGTPRAMRRANPDNMFNLDYNENRSRSFNAEKVKNAFIKRGGSTTAGERTTPDAMRYKEALRVNSLALIDAHPETLFYMVLLPLPHVEWYKMRTEGCLDAMLEFTDWMARELIARPNVALYDFVTLPEMTMNLDNFRDLAHFSPRVSHAILQHVGRGEQRVTTEDVATMIERLRWMSLPENVPDWAVATSLHEGSSEYTADAPEL